MVVRGAYFGLRFFLSFFLCSMGYTIIVLCLHLFSRARRALRSSLDQSKGGEVLNGIFVSIIVIASVCIKNGKTGVLNTEENDCLISLQRTGFQLFIYHPC